LTVVACVLFHSQFPTDRVVVHGVVVAIALGLSHSQGKI
jgi:hypothetical protein